MDNDINYLFSKLDTSKSKLFINFLNHLHNDEHNSMFHPHAFDTKTIESIIKFSIDGPDEYWLLGDQNEIVAYGLLRGWSEGFIIPSIGIAVSPNHRCHGFGKKMMLFLHSRARYRGSTKVRLTVYKQNIAAIQLYTKLGYILEPYSDQSLVGFINL